MYSQNRTLVDLIAPAVSALGCEFWGLELIPGGRRSLLRIYIDSEGGVTLDDCERVSRQVEGILDVEEAVRGSYDLEVSSPGQDRPLFTLDQFRRYVGSDIRMRLREKLGGRRRFAGRLASVTADTVCVESGDERVDIPADLIEKARLVPRA